MVMNPEAESLDEGHLLVHAPPTVSNTISPPSHTTATDLRVSDVRDSQSTNLRSTIDEVERKAIIDALEKTGGNQSAAARMLGIGRHALINRIEAYGLARPRKSS
jgi:DNA-binding NtrC family response regulator